MDFSDIFNGAVTAIALNKCIRMTKTVSFRKMYFNFRYFTKTVILWIVCKAVWCIGYECVFIENSVLNNNS